MRPFDAFEKEIAQQIIEKPQGTLLSTLINNYLTDVLIRVDVNNNNVQVLLPSTRAESFIASGRLDKLYEKIVSTVNLLELLLQEKYIVVAQTAHQIDDPVEFGGRGIQREESIPYAIPDRNIINMLIGYVNRNIYPTQALTEYVNNGFKTAQDVRHDREIEATDRKIRTTERNIKIALTGIIVSALIGLTGLFMNYRSLDINNKNAEMLLEANKIRLGAAIRQQQSVLYEMTFKDNQLMAFFADPVSDGKPRDIADNYIRLLLNTEEYRAWKPSYRKWRSAEDLFDILFQPDDFHNPAKIKLRKAFDMAEHLLYMLQDVYSAGGGNHKLLNREEYDTWMPYIDDTAANPLFLSALYLGHSSGYMTKEFAQFLRERIQKNERNRAIVAVIYSDMLKPDWIERLGKRQHDEFRKKTKQRQD